MKNNFLILVLLLFTSCAHQALKLPHSSDRLFPEGTYQHSVKIHTEQPAPRTMEMRGIVASRPDKLKVIGLSTFNTTIFRIEEDLKTGEIKKEFYLDIIRQHEARFIEFYQLIRELLIAKKGELDFTRKGAHFLVSAPDAQGIYRHIQITHPQFSLDIEVTAYEF